MISPTKLLVIPITPFLGNKLFNQSACYAMFACNRDERDDTVTSSKKKSNKKTGNKTAAVKKDVEKPKDPCQLKLRHDDYGIETKAEKEPKLKQPALKQLLDAKVLGELQISASKPIKRMLVSPGGQWFDNVSRIITE